MNMKSPTSWHEANQAYLLRELGVVRRAIERCAAHSGGASEEGENKDAVLNASPSDLDPPPTLERLCRAFGLSRFEKEILLLCAAMDLDSSFARLLAAARNDSRSAFPTFSLAMAALNEPHWSALSPAAPLRRWRLIEINAGESLTSGRIRIDERVLHYLAGVSHLDDRLSGLLEQVAVSGELPPSHQSLVQTIVRAWSAPTESMLPAVQLCGGEAQSKRDIATAACAQLDLALYAIAAHALPAHPAELDAFVRLWQREAVLDGCALFVESSDADLNDAARQSAITRVLEDTRGVMFLSGSMRRAALRRPMLTLEVGKPSAKEQRVIWSRRRAAISSLHQAKK